MSRRSLAVIAALFGLSGMPAQAADGRWLRERFDIVVRDQPVRDVLREFGVMVDMPVFISPAVDGQISVRFDGASGEEIIEAIARERGLDWRYDGRRLEVTSHDEQVTRLLEAEGVSREMLVSALKSIGVHDPKFPISALDGTLALVAGPPRYVAIVEVVLAELSEKQALAAARQAADEAERLAGQKLAEEELRLAAEREREEHRLARERHEAEMRQQAERRRLEAERAAQRAIDRAERQEEQAMRLAAMREEMRLRALERAAIAREEAVARARALAARGPVVVRGGVTGG